MTKIRINISKTFGDLLVFSNLFFEVSENRIYSIVGPTGCGKTTLLNLISGIDVPTTGTVEINGPNNIGYLFQESVLLPWRTLKENICLSLEVLKEGKSTIEEYLRKFDLSGFENYYPENLSGGMKQRTALIRCLVGRPNILLLDEPFSNIDFDIKLKIQKEILEYQKKTGALVILVTHDIEDAITLSDEVIILSGKPTMVKKQISIDLGLNERDPITARKSADFSNYFSLIWDELKYLNRKEL